MATTQEVKLEYLLRQFTESAREKLRKAKSSSAIPEDHLKNDDDFRLAKAVMDSMCRDRPFAPRLPQHKDEFDNLHASI